MLSDDRDRPTIRDNHYVDAETLWSYHRLGQELQRYTVGVGLGGHDLTVATYAAQLFNAGHFDLLVFTGANSATTRDLFPRGEAVHFSEEASRCGVPETAMLVEPNATNTGQNVDHTRAVLEGHGHPVASVLWITKPSQERRTYTTACKIWPEVQNACTSKPVDFHTYLDEIGDHHRVLEFLVGDLSRIIAYPSHGYAIEQHVPDEVLDAYHRLIAAGYDSRTVPTNVASTVPPAPT